VLEAPDDQFKVNVYAVIELNVEAAKDVVGATAAV